MAGKYTDRDGREYVIVDKEDWTLTTIAGKYLGDPRKYTTLAAINNIADPNLIHTGQKIYLTAGGSGGGGSSSTTSANSNCANISQLYVKAGTDDTLYVTWTWSKEVETESYKVVWTYSTKQDVEWSGNDHEIKIDDHDKTLLPLYCQDTFQIPQGAVWVACKVKPIAKKKDGEDNDVDTRLWEADWSEKVYYNVKEKPLDISGSINVTLTGLHLKVELTDVADYDKGRNVTFQLVRNNTSKVTQQKVKIDEEYNYATWTFKLENDGIYKVRYKLHSGSLGSNWSDYSEEVVTAPVAPSEFKQPRALSESSVYLEWSSVTTATGYEIEYTTDVTYFDSNPDEITSRSIDSKITHTEITNMESGKEYFFRLRATNSKGNDDNQFSEWTEIKSVIIGTTPEAPTTWSSANTVITGEPLTLYWSHNCEDGSKWRHAEVRLYVDDVLVVPDHTEHNESTDEDEDTVGSYSIDTTRYSEGTKIDWQIRTMGIVNTYGEWSTPRTVDIYAQPTLELSVTDSTGEMIDTLTSFPMYVRGLAGPNTQAPLSYHLSVIANETYDTTDSVGNEKIVRAGDEVYSRHFDTTENPLMVELSAGNIDLENNVSYTVVCTAAMNSGLTSEASKDFTVSWEEIGYSPNAAVGINNETWTAQINPYCENITQAYHKVSYANGVYTVLDDIVDGVAADIWIYDEETGQYSIDETKSIAPVGITSTGEDVYEGVFSDGSTGHYCMVETREVVDGVTLAVYRREFDGTFTEIATGVNNAKSSFVTDPHPSLDYARYRIVATTTSTGAVAYTDLPGTPVGCKSIIIQWDEEWTSFNVDTDDALAQSPYSGSMLTLSYNVDVSDNNDPEVDLVRYIGRKNPTTYYGTQIGQTSTWSTAIPKTDKDTLYALRRLAVWMGDCYVREPSGSGYWANVKVTFNQKHKSVTIPVSFNITRVEGGV